MMINNDMQPPRRRRKNMMMIRGDDEEWPPKVRLSSPSGCLHCFTVVSNNRRVFDLPLRQPV